MSLTPDKLASLVRWGMADIVIRASKFDPPVGSRGIQGNMKAVEWAVTIMPKDASRPMVRAIRPDIAEATEAAVDRFLAIFRDGKDLDPFGESVAPAAPAKRERTTVLKKPKPAAKPVIDEDDLI